MEGDKIVTLHEASLVEIEPLQVFLEENNISTSLRDEFNEGLHAGFPNGIPNQVSLYVLENQLEKAKALMQLYQKS